jgi:hypothetical protein
MSRVQSRSGNNELKIILGFALLVAICLLVLVYVTTAGCSDLPGVRPCVRILFIGNSFTYVNDLPGMFVKLARAGGHKVETGMAAEGGWTLAEHANSAATLDQLKSVKWNFVVLQEQSLMPAFEQSRTASMYPSARWLVSQVKAAQAEPIFFLTWAYRAGSPEYGLKGYEDMQIQIERGYLTIAQELAVPVAPVGMAWLAARRETPQLDLWQEDGTHPNETGTYLAACVFYAVLFRQSPEGLTYRANLPGETAAELQTIAAQTVLKNPKQWMLP